MFSPSSSPKGPSSSPSSTPDTTPRQRLQSPPRFQLDLDRSSKPRSHPGLLSPRQTSPTVQPSPTPRKKLAMTLNLGSSPLGQTPEIGSPRSFFSPRNRSTFTPYKATGSLSRSDTLVDPPPFRLPEPTADDLREEPSPSHRSRQRAERAVKNDFPGTVPLQKEIRTREKDGTETCTLLPLKIRGHVVLDAQPRLPALKQALLRYAELTRVIPLPDQKPHQAARDASQVLEQLLGDLCEAIAAQDRKPTGHQRPDVPVALQALHDRLTREQARLKPLCSSRRIGELRQHGVEMPSGSRLVDMMVTSQLPQERWAAWQAEGFDVRDLAHGERGELELTDLQQVLPDWHDRPTRVADARLVLAARLLFPGMDKARFLALAPVLVERQVPLELLSCMADHEIEPHPHNLPSAEHLLRAASCEPRPLGQGRMGTAYLLALGTERWVFKAEQEQGPSEAGLGAGMPETGANTTGRVLASARFSQLLGLDTVPEALPFWMPPRDGQPGRYGSISRLVKGPMMQAGLGDVATHRLDNDFHLLSARKHLPQLQDIAQRHGFGSVELDDAGRTLTWKPRTEYLHPLQTASVAARISLSEASVVELLTGQVDGHPGNYLLENGQAARLIDTAESFPPGLTHPLGLITEPAPVIQAWDQHLQHLVSAIRGGQPMPAPPRTVGELQRADLLRMTETTFVQRWARDLPWGQQQLAWLAMEGLQARLADRQRIASVPDRVASDGNTAVHCHGWPPVIASGLKARVLALDEASVKQTLAPYLTPEEVDATWSRTRVLQQMLQVPGAIHEVHAVDDWTSAEVTRRLGWAPDVLDPAADALSGHTGSEWERRALRRSLLMSSGLPGALALDEHLMRRAIATAPPDAPYRGTALFDVKALLAALNLG